MAHNGGIFGGMDRDKNEDLAGLSLITEFKNGDLNPNESIDDVAVDLSSPKLTNTDEDGVEFTEMDGEITIDFDPQDPELEVGKESHEENLALRVEESTLNSIANRLIEYVKIDIESRESWTKRYEEGIENLGLTDEVDSDMSPFKGASIVSYPLLSTAVVQFQSRAISEMYPSGGPIKTKLLGTPDEQREQQAKRVKDHMNYQVTEQDEGFFDELDQLLFYLPIGGSAFKKVYYDESAYSPVSKFVRPEDLIVNYTTVNLETSSRYTHRLQIQQNEMRKLQHSGFYRPCELIRPDSEDRGTADGNDTIQKVDDKLDNKTSQLAEFDHRHEVYEVHCDWDLPGFKHKENGEETGIELPYIISVDTLSNKVLSIRRNWKEEDETMKKRVWFIHFKYIPGTGFYGFGLLHLIGRLSEASTGTLRALLDSAARATMQGGFKSKDSNVKSGDLEITPGVYTDVDATADELAKSFYTVPTKDPAPAMFQLLGFLVEAGERLTSTTEAMVGDASNNGPVGTTLALIEQGSKVYSAIHKRLHQSAGKEYKLRAELNYEYLDQDQEYPYDVVGGERTIKGADYDGRVDVVPVSDPNIFSSAQRIAQAQAVKALADEHPERYKGMAVEKAMLMALNVADPENLLIDDENKERLDAVSENMAILMQKPVTTFQDQDHDSHIAAHKSFLDHPEFGGHPQAREMAAPAMIAHIAEHLAYKYRQNFVDQGVPIPDINLSAQHGEELLSQPLSPEADAMISQAVARNTEAFMQMSGLKPEPQPPTKSQLEMQNHKQKLQQKDEDHKQSMTQSDQEHQQDMAHKDQAFKIDKKIDFKEKTTKAGAEAIAVVDEGRAVAQKIEKGKDLGGEQKNTNNL